MAGACAKEEMWFLLGWTPGTADGTDGEGEPPGCWICSYYGKEQLAGRRPSCMRLNHLRFEPPCWFKK